MKRRFFVIVVAVMMLLGAFAMNAAATDELADVYVATTGVDTNAGTVEAPVLGLNKALELVKNGGYFVSPDHTESFMQWYRDNNQ